MADEAFAAGSVAQMGRVSVKREGGALLRISQALHGLVSSLVNSLQEYQDVGTALELETVTGPDETEVKPELLVVAAATLKGMVETLVSDIKASAEVQRLLPAIQKCSGAHDHHAFFQDLMISKQKQLSCFNVDTLIPGSEETPDGSRRAKRTAVMGPGICKHSCEHHPELVDRWLWRKLPQEMVELVFAKLPLLDIIDLSSRFRAWGAMSVSSNFHGAFSERFPKLIGLLWWQEIPRKILSLTIYDIKSFKWVLSDVSLQEYTDAYKNSMYACDGGLVCFVPQEHLMSSPIVVCNPLTNDFKSLPLIPLVNFEEKEIIMVQLLMEDDTKCYRVILVSCGKIEQDFSAHLYHSKTGAWSVMDSGLVYGDGSKLETGPGIPKVFDCATKVLRHIRHCNSLRNKSALAYSMVRDNLYVLHPGPRPISPGTMTYHVSKYTWESSVSNLRLLKRSDTWVKMYPGYVRRIFASHGFSLLFTDNGEARHKYQPNRHQQLSLRDEFRNVQQHPPSLRDEFKDVYDDVNDDVMPVEDLQRLFMSELRWDINP